MSRNDVRGERVFVSMNSDGQVVIRPADALGKSRERIGLDSGPPPAPRQDAAELDSAGRLRLPADIAAFLRRP